MIYGGDRDLAKQGDTQTQPKQFTTMNWIDGLNSHQLGQFSQCFIRSVHHCKMKSKFMAVV